MNNETNHLESVRGKLLDIADSLLTGNFEEMTHEEKRRDVTTAEMLIALENSLALAANE